MRFYNGLYLIISADAICLASYTSSMHAVMYNPAEPRLLATANAKEGLGLWDVRKPKRLTCNLKKRKIQIKNKIRKCKYRYILHLKTTDRLWLVAHNNLYNNTKLDLKKIIYTYFLQLFVKIRNQCCSTKCQQCPNKSLG